MMLRFFLFTFAILALFAGVALAKQSFAGRVHMNGYSLMQFGHFIRDWHLVTVRYRQDTGEMRFTYANDVAWEALKAGVMDYPDGAVFAKYSVITQEDPAFPSSHVPSGGRRYQLMVMDKAKNKETDGWGYALFGPDGLTKEEDPVIKTQACHACHLLVPERGYVFSKRMALGMPRDIPASMPADQELGKTLEYKTVTRDELPERVRKILPAEYKQVRMLQGLLRKHLFSGTLDEIRPALIKESVASDLPALLLAEKGDAYSIVFINPDVKTCTLKGGEVGVSLGGGLSVGRNFENDKPFEACLRAPKASQH